MAFSYISKLFKQLSKSRWIQIYFALVVIQTILSLPILIKTFINTEGLHKSSPTRTKEEEDIANDYNTTIFGNYFISKEYKIMYENILFIVYEVWRTWILVDGIVHLNSLTILASAWFSVFSCMFNVMLVIESKKWTTSGFDVLKLENMRLQIALTVVFFLLSIPVIIAAYKSSKVIGWQVYKKIGSSIKLQNMYHRVQWFALALKVDIFFQVFLLVGAAIISETLPFRIFSIIMSILITCSMLLSRIAITRESNWMMIVFITLQVVLLGCDVYTLVGLFQYPPLDLWFAGIVYVIASIVCAAVNIYLAVTCQMNFGKGLKSFVRWYPFQRKKRDDEEQSRSTTKEGLLGVKVDERLPIDDEDDDYYYNISGGQQKFEEEIKYAYYHQNKDIDSVSRTSLERVERSISSSLYYNTIKTNPGGRQNAVKLHSIEIPPAFSSYHSQTSPQPQTLSPSTMLVPKLALKPIVPQSPSSEEGTTIVSESDIADNKDYDSIDLQSRVVSNSNHS